MTSPPTFTNCLPQKFKLIALIGTGLSLVYIFYYIECCYYIEFFYYFSAEVTSASLLILFLFIFILGNLIMNTGLFETCCFLI